MKKLMIAAAIVCAAALSQAATCYWNFKNAAGDNVMNYANSGTFTGIGYIFLGASGQDDVLSAWRTDGTISGYETTVSITDGAFSIKGYTTETDAAKQSWYIVLEDGNNLLISDALSKNVQTAATGRDVPFALGWTSDSENEVKFDKDTLFAGHGEGWYAAGAVPEPTSGLLLLLGVAGLALRRRRA